MTIAERTAREAYDRENPWRPMCEAKPDGTVCELLFSDLVGSFEADPFRYFLDPPERVYSAPSPINWRPTYARIRPERRYYLKRQATRRTAV